MVFIYIFFKKDIITAVKYSSMAGMLLKNTYYTAVLLFPYKNRTHFREKQGSHDLIDMSNLCTEDTMCIFLNTIFNLKLNTPYLQLIVFTVQLFQCLILLLCFILCFLITCKNRTHLLAVRRTPARPGVS